MFDVNGVPVREKDIVKPRVGKNLAQRQKEVGKKVVAVDIDFFKLALKDKNVPPAAPAVIEKTVELLDVLIAEFSPARALEDDQVGVMVDFKHVIVRGTDDEIVAMGGIEPIKK